MLIDPQAEEIIDRVTGSQEVPVILKLKDPNLIPPEVRTVSQFGDIITCRVRSDMLRELKAHKFVYSLKAARFLKRELPDEIELLNFGSSSSAKSDTDNYRVPRKFTGLGVTIGILDFGIHFASKAFRKEDGTTRFEKIWDQRAAMPPDNPNPYGYGRIYGREEIDRALLEKDPYLALGYSPSDGNSLQIEHGTFVTDIAAGSRRMTPQGELQGIAPDARLIFVHLGSEYTGGLYNLSDSVTVLEGFHLVTKTVGDSPCVVNMSLGNTGGAKDGSGMVVRAIDNLLASRDGLACITSNGNYRQAQTHSHARIRPGSNRTFRWFVDPADVTPNELEVWYPGTDRLTICIRAPDGKLNFSASFGEKVPIEINGRRVGSLYNRMNDPLNKDNQCEVFLYTDAPAGWWNVTLQAEDVVDGRVHINVERDSGNPHNQSRLHRDDAKERYTLGSICNGRRAISVGAFDSRTPDRSVASFSSCGPTRDGRQKPDCVAPGVQILAVGSTAKNSATPDDILVAMSGASMAAPHVTGAVALVFQAAPRKLSISETQSIILGSVDKVSKNNECFGDGYLNIDAAIQAAMNVGGKHINPGSEDIHIDRLSMAASQDATPEVVQEALLDMEVEEHVSNQPDPHEVAKIADRIISSGNTFSLRRLLGNTFSEDKLESVGLKNLTPKEIFDSFAFGQSPIMRRNLKEIFEVIGMPGSTLVEEIKEGDLLFTEILGTNYSQESVIASPKQLSLGEIASLGLSAERNEAGQYVKVLEGGPRPHLMENSFYRMILDQSECVPHNRLILRLRKTNQLFDDINQSSFWPLTESPPKLNPEECKKDWIKFRDTFPVDVREALADGNVSSAITIAIHQGIRDRTKLIKLGYLAKHGEERGYCYPIQSSDVVAKGEHQWMEGEVKQLLSRPSPPLAQKGLIKCRRRERRLDSAHPDGVGFDITGRYELRYTPKISSDPTSKAPRITQYILHINQAGKHLEGFITDVLRPDSQQPERYSTRFHGDLQDDSPRFLVFSRSKPDEWWGYLSFEMTGQKGQLYLQMMVNPDPDAPAQGPKIPLWQVAELPTVMDWDWLFAGVKVPDWEIIYLHERWPLSRDQVDHLVQSFKEENIAPLLQAYFSTPADDTVSGRKALDKASSKLEEYVLKAFTQKDFGIFEKDFYKSDLTLARYYVRMILSQNKWTFKQKTLSQLDWIQIMLDVLTQLGSGLAYADKYLGLKPTVLKGGKPIDPTMPPNKYKISINLDGFAVYFRGEITVRKVTGQQWTESFKISLWGLQVKPGVNIKEEGEAETYGDWKPSDIPGKVVFLTAAIGGKIPIIKARAGAWILQIFGSEIYPYMDVHGKDVDVGVHGGTKIKKSRLDFINLGGLRGDIYEKKLPDKDYSKFAPIIDYSTVYGLKEDVHFCLDSAILTEDGRQALRIISANYLPAFMSPDSTLEIVGHADRLDTPKNNYDLSKWRAENTKQAIIDILGNRFMIKKVNTWGEGETQAAKVDPDQTPNPQYRRVDISLNSRLIISLRSG